MDWREGPSHTSPSFVGSTNSTNLKARFSRFLKSEQTAVDSELAALEEAIRRSSFALLPAILTPSRAPSNALIASSRALFFEGPFLLDFASGWARGPVIEWYDRRRRKGSTLTQKLQLRRDPLAPYYHEYIVVFTQDGHTYRIDRRPDTDAPFDTIMKAGCKPYDTIQTIGSRSLSELEKSSNCVVELRWRGKLKIDLLFVLSICFALRQDQRAKQYTLQRYNCYFLSWTIIMVAVRQAAAWGARLGDVLSEPFLHIERVANHRVARAVSQALSQQGVDTGALGRHLDYHSGRHMELALARALVRVPTLAQAQVRVDPSLDLALELALSLALESAPMRKQVQALEWELEVDRSLDLTIDLAMECEPDLVRTQRKLERARAQVISSFDSNGKRGQGRALEQALEGELERVQARTRAQTLKLELELILTKRWKLNLDLDYALGLVQKLELRLVRLVLEQYKDAMSKLLFPAALDVWQSTVMWNIQNEQFLRRLNGLHSLDGLVQTVRRWMAKEAERAIRSTVSKLVVLPVELSISLAYKVRSYKIVFEGLRL